MSTSEFMSAFLEEGYCIVDLLTEEQVDLIAAQIKARVWEEVPPGIRSKIGEDWDLGHYHEVIGADEAVHKSIARISHRYITPPADIIDAIVGNPLPEIMMHYWGHTDTLVTHRRNDPDEPLANDTACGFRLARPGKSDAVGVHVDRYYGTRSELTRVDASKPSVVTTWIPIVGFDERYSLRLAPRSHTIDHPSAAFSRTEGYVTHTCDETYESKFEYIRPPLKKGQVIVFHPNLLHGASLNLGDQTRVSIEPRLRDRRAFSVIEKRVAS